MIKISFFNQKGGVGKTTSVVNLAAAFSITYKKKVIVFDCDSQMTATNYLLSFTNYHYSIEDYFSDDFYEKRSLKDIVVKAMLKDKINSSDTFVSNISVIPSSLDIETISIDDPKLIGNVLSEIEEDYDYCFFDLPPHFSGISISALVASDFVIVPAHADTDSLAGYDNLIDTIKEIRTKGLNLKLSILGILYNDVNKQRMIQQYILNSSYSSMKDTVFKTYIKSASAIEQARYMGVPLIGSGLNKKIEKDYIELSKEIIKRIKEMENKNA